MFGEYLSFLMVFIIVGNCTSKYITNNYVDEKFVKINNHEYDVLKGHVIEKNYYSEQKCLGKCNINDECKSINFYKNITLSEEPCHLLNNSGKVKLNLNATCYNKTKMASPRLQPDLCSPCELIESLGADLSYICDCKKATELFSFNNCEEALSTTNLVPGLYNINPSGDGNGIDVYCHKMIGKEYGCSLLEGDPYTSEDKYIGIFDNKDICIRNCMLKNGNNKIAIIGSGGTSRENECWCSTEANMDERTGNAWETCFIVSNHLEGVTWTTILQIVEAPLYFDSSSKYLNGYGSLLGNYWLGLQNFYRLISTFNITLRIEYYLENYDKMIMEYINFKFIDNITFAMTYALYSPIRTNGDATDNLICRRGQPFVIVPSKGGFWGDSRKNDIPFSFDGIFWGGDKNIKKMKWSIRKHDKCEQIVGDYALGTEQHTNAKMTYANGRILALYLKTNYHYAGSIQLDNNKQCSGYIKHENYELNFAIIFDPEKCKITFTEENGNSWYWKKLSCSPRKVIKSCQEVQETECDNGLYSFGNQLVSCINGDTSVV